MDHAARFAELIDEAAYQKAWRCCWRLTREAGGSYQDAEDLLQEALSRAYLKLEQLRDPDAACGWLISIVRSIHLRRAGQRSRRRTADLDAAPTVADSRGGNEPLTDAVAAALARLPRSQRELLSLFYIDGLNLEETGRVLGLGVPAVKMRLQRARHTLRRQLQPQHALGDFSALL